MDAMPRHRRHRFEFKRRIAQAVVAGETLPALAKRHDLPRNLIRIWAGIDPVLWTVGGRVRAGSS